MIGVNFLLKAEDRIFKNNSKNRKFLYSIPVFPVIFLSFIFLIAANISYFIFHIGTGLLDVFITFNILFIPSFLLLFIKYAGSISQTEASEETHQTETRYKSLIESMNYMVARIDTDGNFVFVNESFCKKMGKDPEELVGTPFQPIMHPADLENTLRKLDSLKEPPHRVIVEQRAETVEGWRWIEWECTAIFDRNGNFREVQGIGRDITERKDAEVKLHLQEMAIQRTVNGVVITDPTKPDNPVIFCNPAYEKMTGYFANEVIGRNPRFLQGPETDRFTVEKMRIAVKRQEECNVTLLNYKKDGTPFWNEIRIIPIRDKENKLLNYLAIKRDVSDRIGGEKIIKESEIKFRSVVEQSIDGIMLIDEFGVIIDWNYALEKITGIAKKEMIGKSILEIDVSVASGNPDSRDNGTRLKNVIINIIEKKGTRDFNRSIDDEIILKSGQKKSLQSIVYPIITDKGVMIGTVIRDITLTKTMEKQNAILHRAIESSASGMVLFNLNFELEYINNSIVQMVGAKTEQELVGKTVLDFISRKDFDAVKNEYIPELLKNEEWFGEIELKKLNGEPLSSEVNCSIVKNDDNSQVYLLAIVNDITSRKQSEKALIESEQKYRQVVDHIKEIIFKTDAAGIWEFLNPAWEEIMGYTREESIGKLFLDYVYPEDRVKNNKEFEKLVCRSKDYCRHVIRYVTKSGDIKWIEVFARLTLNEKDEIIGTSGSLYDITEKYLAEQEMKEALAKEKELSELKSRFVSTVSHEFRTPLTSILASAELMLRYNEKWNTDKKLNTLKRIQNSALFMNEMVSGVLDLNRAESGRLVYTPVKLELISFLKEIVEEVRPLSKETHDLIFSAENENINGQFDEKMLKSVVINLLSNAIKYSPEGGKVELKIGQESSSVNISVSDSGMGIPQEDQNNLFLPFFRANNIGNISGTGLGLSIVKKNIELQKGQISFISEHGKGTTFFVTLPLNN